MKVLKSYTLIILFLLTSCSVKSVADNSAYHIEVTIKNTKDTVCYLGYPYGDKKYIADTAILNKKGMFVFEGDKPLDGGLYFIYHPNSLYFDVVVNESNFSLSTDTLDIIGNMKTEGSIENKLFFDVQNFMKSKQKEAEAISVQLKGLKEDSEEAKVLKEKLKGLDTEVQNYRQNLIDKNPQTFVSKFIKSTMNIDVPDGPKDENGKELDPNFKYKYYKVHYFDNIDFSDDKMLRTPIFNGKIEDYLERLTVKHPDSVISSAHYIIEKARANKEVFRYCVVSLTYKYETSNIMGMDAVFVDLAEKYYLSGDAYWADSTLLAKIDQGVKAIKPNLIGNPAPKLIVLDTLLRPFSLRNDKAEYTVLYFYSPDCGHCKKKTPDLKKLYDSKLKAKGVEVFAICVDKDIDKWKKFIKDYEIQGLVNGADPYLHSNFRAEYNIETTPQIYVVDEKKTIIAKKLDIDQIDEFIERQMEIKKEQNPG